MMRQMSDRQLTALVEVAHFQQDQDCFAQAVMLSLRSCLELEFGKPVHLWVNLEKLLRWANVLFFKRYFGLIYFMYKSFRLPNLILLIKIAEVSSFKYLFLVSLWYVSF